MGNLGTGVHWLLSARKGLDWQSPEELSGKAAELVCQGTDTV